MLVMAVTRSEPVQGVQWGEGAVGCGSRFLHRGCVES